MTETKMLYVPETEPFRSRDQLVREFGNPMVNPSRFEREWIVSTIHTIANDRDIAVRCNTDLAPVLHNIWLDLTSQGLLGKIVSYNGCFNVRNIRGVQGVPSLHAFGLAIDLNAETNQLGTEGDMPMEIVQIFKHHGMFWGGDFIHRKDPMHFELTDGSF
jgi:hypothetical protein